MLMPTQRVCAQASRVPPPTSMVAMECAFLGILEPIAGTAASIFASAIMKMLLCFDFCHTIVLDKDSKLFSIGRESLNLLKTGCHVLSGDSHNPMLVKWLCLYFNKGLWIMTNECNLVHVALEELLLLLYAWNSCSVPGTDISPACGNWPQICLPY